MSNPRLVLSALAVSLLIIGCRSAPDPVMQEIVPTGPTPEEIEGQRIADSIRAYNEEMARRQAELEAAEREAARRAAAARNSLTQTVYFDFDESTIRTDTETALREKVGILRANPAVMLRMEGHADERGTSEYNIALGNERAEAVIQFLAGFGISSDRFTSVSYGEEQPAATGSNEDAWARNRRVEFVITAGGDSIVGE